MIICCFLDSNFFSALIQGFAIVLAAYIGISIYKEKAEYNLRLKERFKVRKEMYDKYIAFQITLNDNIKDGSISLEKWNLIIKKLEEVRPYFQIYGTAEQRDAMEQFIEAITNSQMPDGINEFDKRLKKLRDIVLKSIKLEYRIEN